MINPLQEKKMLIESMKKLVSHVSNNPQRQVEIFHALSTQDLNKIIVNLKDDNEYLRRISALLLCELFFLNEQTRQKAIRLLSINPSEGRMQICLGGIPESISKYPSTLKRCLELMRSPLEEDEEMKMCWVINLERKILKIQAMDYKKYSSFTFLDPHKNIFGFTLKPKLLEPLTPRSTLHTQQQSRIYESPPYQAQQTNSQFYKGYVEAIKKTSESKRSSFQGNYINMGLNQTDRSPIQSKKLTPTHLNVTLTPKRQHMRNSMDYSSKLTQQLTMTIGRGQRLNNSVHIPAHYTQLGKYGNDPIRVNYNQPQREMRGVRPSVRQEVPVPQPHKTQDRFYNKVRQILHK